MNLNEVYLSTNGEINFNWSSCIISNQWISASWLKTFVRAPLSGFLRLGSFEGLQGSIVYPSSDSLHLHVLFCFRLIPGDKLVFWNLFLISHLSKILIEMKFKTIGYYNQNLPIQVVSLQPPSQLVLWPFEKSLRNVFLALFFCICPQPRRLWPVLSSWRWNGKKKFRSTFYH